MKRRLIPILALLLAWLPVSAHAQSFSFSWSNDDGGQFSLLLDENGQPLTDPQEYSEIYGVDLENGWFAAHSLTEFGTGADAYHLYYALMNAQGQVLTEEKYQGLYAGGADRIIYMDVAADQGLCYGLLDASGAEITPAAYSCIFPDGGTGFYATKETVGENAPLYHLDHDGNAQATGYACPLYLSENPSGLCPAQDPETGLYGYLDSHVQWAIAPQFQSVNAFENGYAMVTSDAAGLYRYGLIDESGRQILPCEFDWITTGRYIIASRSLEDGTSRSEVYDPSGTLLFTYGGSVSDYGLYFCGWPSNAEGTELLDASGSVVRSLPSAEGYFYSGSEDTLFFYDNSDGLTYWMKDAYTPIGSGYASLRYARSDGGRVLCITGEARMAYDAQDGYWYPEWASLRYGLIDGEGNVLISAQYRELLAIPGTDFFSFADDSGHGAIDASGNVLYYRSDYLELMD